MPGFRAARVELVGRRRELTSLRRWLVSVDATPHAMLILGEPGMGKTTLWFALLRHAEALGTTVAVSRPSRPESRLALLVLADLLDDLITAEPEEFAALPEVQRDLLDAVRTGVAPPGPRTWRGVAAAFLELLRSAATVRPVLLAIDDRQWSDASSARVLDFALSRCGEQPVRLLATQRLGLSERTSPADPDPRRLDARAMVLGPLPETDLMRMLRRIGPVPPEVAAAAVDGSGANPFVALELARSLLDPPVTGGRNPLPRSLRDIAGSRLRGLSDHGLIVCRLTCMVGRPTTRTLHGILGRDTADAGLDDAEAAGVLELRDGLWAFRHPLLAAAVHDLIAPAVRRDLHARAAAVIVEREERVWHLVGAARGPDEAVAVEATRPPGGCRSEALPTTPSRCWKPRSGSSRTRPRTRGRPDALMPRRHSSRSIGRPRRWPWPTPRSGSPKTRRCGPARCRSVPRSPWSSTARRRRLTTSRRRWPCPPTRLPWSPR